MMNAVGRTIVLTEDAKQSDTWCAPVKCSDAPFTLSDDNGSREVRLLGLTIEAGDEDALGMGKRGEAAPTTDARTTRVGMELSLRLEAESKPRKQLVHEPQRPDLIEPPGAPGQVAPNPVLEIQTTPLQPVAPLPERRKEPVPPGSLPTPSPPRVRGPEPLPDDASFLDIVGLGAADGFHCSGVLVAPDLVLTAAHCLPTTRVAVGSYLADPIVELAVVAEVRHPTLDAAVLRLARAIPVPVRERRTAADRSVPRGTMRLVGFGVDAPRTLAGFGIKRRLDLEVDSWGCDLARAAATGCQRGAEMVVAGIAGRDTCLGDSGGPVLELQDESLRLVAITSRPVASGGARCGRGGIYVRVDALDTWLTTIQQETTP